MALAFKSWWKPSFTFSISGASRGIFPSNLASVFYSLFFPSVRLFLSFCMCVLGSEGYLIIQFVFLFYPVFINSAVFSTFFGHHLCSHNLMIEYGLKLRLFLGGIAVFSILYSLTQLCFRLCCFDCLGWGCPSLILKKILILGVWSDESVLFSAATRDRADGQIQYGFGIQSENLREARFISLQELLCFDWINYLLIYHD